MATPDLVRRPPSAASNTGSFSENSKPTRLVPAHSILARGLGPCPNGLLFRPILYSREPVPTVASRASTPHLLLSTGTKNAAQSGPRAASALSRPTSAHRSDCSPPVAGAPPAGSRPGSSASRTSPSPQQSRISFCVAANNDSDDNGGNDAANSAGTGAAEAAAALPAFDVFGERILRGENTVVVGTYFRFTGAFVEGRREGPGTLELGDGGSLTGTFVKGELQGRGVRFWPDGSCYRGDFERGEQHGSGVHCGADGHVYRGEYRFGVRQGFGALWVPVSAAPAPAPPPAILRAVGTVPSKPTVTFTAATPTASTEPKVSPRKSALAASSRIATSDAQASAVDGNSAAADSVRVLWSPFPRNASVHGSRASRSVPQATFIEADVASSNAAEKSQPTPTSVKTVTIRIPGEATTPPPPLSPATLVVSATEVGSIRSPPAASFVAGDDWHACFEFDPSSPTATNKTAATSSRNEDGDAAAAAAAAVLVSPKAAAAAVTTSGALGAASFLPSRRSLTGAPLLLAPSEGLHLHYEGQFRRGAFHGTGELRTCDFTVRGTFSRGAVNGLALKRYRNGDIFQGAFVSDVENGRGAFVHRASGVTYNGEMRDGRRAVTPNVVALRSTRLFQRAPLPDVLAAPLAALAAIGLAVEAKAVDGYIHFPVGVPVTLSVGAARGVRSGVASLIGPGAAAGGLGGLAASLMFAPAVAFALTGGVGASPSFEHRRTVAPGSAAAAAAAAAAAFSSAASGAGGSTAAATAAAPGARAAVSAVSAVGRASIGAGSSGATFVVEESGRTITMSLLRLPAGLPASAVANEVAAAMRGCGVLVMSPTASPAFAAAASHRQSASFALSSLANSTWSLPRRESNETAMFGSSIPSQNGSDPPSRTRPVMLVPEDVADDTVAQMYESALPATGGLGTGTGASGNAFSVGAGLAASAYGARTLRHSSTQGISQASLSPSTASASMWGAARRASLRRVSMLGADMASDCKPVLVPEIAKQTAGGVADFVFRPAPTAELGEHALVFVATASGSRPGSSALDEPPSTLVLPIRIAANAAFSQTLAALSGVAGALPTVVAPVAGGLFPTQRRGA